MGQSPSYRTLTGAGEDGEGQVWHVLSCGLFEQPGIALRAKLELKQSRAKLILDSVADSFSQAITEETLVLCCLSH